jgi:excinuclease UvrABC nuclease subunit
MKLIDLKQFNLPDSPGVYYFLGSSKPGQGGTKGREILYIGKATSLKDRVKSYFARDILLTRSPLIEKMLGEATKVKFVETDSVLEALIFEAHEIKKHQPYYNSKEKDDKSYNYVVLTKEDFPRVLTMRGRELLETQGHGLKIYKQFGPFPKATELKEALKIIRKIFPYRDAKCKIPAEGKPPKPCFNAQIGLCPGPCAGWISKTEYRKNIRHLIMFFEAKKPQLIKSLEKEMQSLAKARKFEEAEKVKRQLFALDHIHDIALIKADLTTNNQQLTAFRIEAYDIAHLSGKDVVGVMTVLTDGELDKSQYRKFKIKKDANNDIVNLREVLERRLNHPEWPYPNLIVVDGGKAQLDAIKDVLVSRDLSIDAVSVVKDERHKAKEILDLKDQSQEKLILLANSEAHRFAIGYHRRLRGKGFRV